MTYPNNQQQAKSYLDRQKEVQIARKGLHLSPHAQQLGLFMGKRRPFCIHEHHSSENLFVSVREQALDYFRSNGIAWHSDLPGKDKPSNHLCDSQICCLNFLLPLRDDAEAVAELLRPVFPSLRRVLPMEDDGGFIAFEWIGLRNYLNEKTIGGVRKRGEYATSADAAVIFEQADGTRQIVLIEWKYSEVYQAISKRFSRNRTDRALIYAPFFHAPDGPIAREKVSDFYDLFYDPFDQLMRQQFLAHEMEKANELGASRVSVLHIAPRANDDFMRVTSPGLARLNAGSAVKTWETLVRDERFVSVYTEELFGRFPWRDFPHLHEWWDYVEKRYGWFE